MARAKKEFNKEAMYKKIMPSMIRGNEENSEENSEENKNVDNNFIEKTHNEIDNNNFEYIVEENSSFDETKDAIDEVIENSISITNNVSDDSKTTVNFIEILVRDKLESVLDKFKCCKCQSCKNDIVVIALNNLPVYYFSGNKKQIEEALIEFKSSNNIDVVTEIIIAIILVRKKDKH